MVSVTFRAPFQSVQIVKVLAKKRQVAESVIFREALEVYLEKENTGICSECGAVVDRASNFCPGCGNKLNDNAGNLLTIFEELKAKFPKEFDKALKQVR